MKCVVVVVVGCKVVVSVVIDVFFFHVTVCIMWCDVGRMDVDVANASYVDSLVFVCVMCRVVVGRVDWSCGCVVVGRVSWLV